MRVLVKRVPGGSGRRPFFQLIRTGRRQRLSMLMSLRCTQPGMSRGNRRPFDYSEQRVIPDAKIGLVYKGAKHLMRIVA